MNVSPIALAACAAVLLTACGAEPVKAPVDGAKVVDAIKSDEVRWNTDWKSGDAGKVTAHYAPGATVMLSGVPAVTGAPAIKAAIQKAIDDPAFSLVFASDKVDVATSGDLAASRGTYRMNFTDPATKAPSTLSGTFVTVYKPGKDGRWKAMWAITTSGPSTVK